MVEVMNGKSLRSMVKGPGFKILRLARTPDAGRRTPGGVRSVVCGLQSVVFRLRQGYGGHSSMRSGARGFTLIELLVVLGVIGILMGLTFPAIQRAIERARITRARTEVQALQQAWLAFRNTYYDPEDPGLFRWPTVTVMDDAAVRILSGADTGENPLGIAFMEFDARHEQDGFLSPFRGPDGERLHYVVDLEYEEGQDDTITREFKTRVYLGNAARGRYLD